MTKSILSEQREADEALCERLDALAYVVFDRGYSEAAQRIRALSEALQEACHERDGLLAKVERHAS